MEQDLAETYIWLGAVHQYTKQYSVAFRYYGDALGKFSQLKNIDGKANAYSWIGHYYEKIGWYDSAKVYERKAFDCFNQSKNELGLSSVLDNLGSIYEDLKMYDSAYFFFNQASLINNELGNTNRLIINLNNMGDIYRKQGNSTMALYFTDSALQLSKTHSLKIQEKYALRDKAKIYEQQNKFDSAYIYSELAYDLHAKILNDKVLQRIAQLNTLYESQRQQAKIDRLERYRKDSKLFRIIIFILVISILTILMLIVNQYRLRNRSDFNYNFLRLLSASNPGLSQEQWQKALLNEQNLKKELEEIAKNEKKLARELTIKDQTINTYVLQEINNKNLLNNLKESLIKLNKTDKNGRRIEIQRLIHLINTSGVESKKWDTFQTIYKNVHNDFFDNLKKEYPDLSPNDLKLAALLKLNLNAKDIASILNISNDSLRVSRYRLRKKLNLDKGMNLVSYLMEC
jgi:DNA-binding CsgD family transcriptional regulator